MAVTWGGAAGRPTCGRFVGGGMMAFTISRTPAGYEVIYFDGPHRETAPSTARLVQQSSAIRPYPGAFDKPGSSCLWVGDHHLDQEAVAELAIRLMAWVASGSLLLPGDNVDHTGNE